MKFIVFFQHIRNINSFNLDSLRIENVIIWLKPKKKITKKPPVKTGGYATLSSFLDIQFK